MTGQTITARAVRSRSWAAAALLCVVGAGWAALHAMTVMDLFHGHERTHFQVVFTLAFAALVWQTALALFERPYTLTDRQFRVLDQYRVVVNVPLYNEDDGITRRSIESILTQTRPVNLVHVVNDGSTAVDYTATRAWALALASERGVELVWTDKANGGKRSCQALTFSTFTDADILVTVDSDAVLAPDAIAEGLKPFYDLEVQCVGAVVMAYNASTNALCRLTDLWFTVGQLTDRSSMSVMGSVLVNSGPLALYRGDLVRDHLASYTNEWFMGKRVEFSDDSLLTLYGVTRGKAVQQPTCYAFTLMPEKVSHHVRQYTRWMRGAFIRSIWRFRYLPVDRYAYWAHLAAWVQTILSLVIFVALFLYQPVVKGSWSALPWLMLVPLLIGYGQALRYLSIERSDQSTRDRLLTFAMSPISSLWAFFVLRFVRLYGIATCRKTGWGTRSKVEVSVT